MPVSPQHQTVLCRSARHTLCSRYRPYEASPTRQQTRAPHGGQVGLALSTGAMAILALAATAAVLRIGNPFTVEPEATAQPAAAAQPTPVPPSATAVATSAPIIVATPTAARAAQAATAMPRVATPAPIYVVQPGDSLTSVAAAHGLTVQRLAAANGLVPTARLLVGQRLILPLP